MIKTLTIWTAFSLTIFASLTVIHYPGYFGTGANSFEGYGWPDGWITKNEYKTYIDYGDGRGMLVDDHSVNWYISNFGGMALACIASFSIPAVVFLPLALTKKKISRKRQPEAGENASRPAA